VKVLPSASGARNFTQCDSLLIGEECGAHTVPYIESRNRSAKIEHEATHPRSPKIQCFTAATGLSEEDRRQPDRQRLLQGCVEGTGRWNSPVEAQKAAGRQS